MAHLAAAIARGGLPCCTTVTLLDNPGNDAPVQEAHDESLARRAPPQGGASGLQAPLAGSRSLSCATIASRTVLVERENSD